MKIELTQRELALAHWYARRVPKDARDAGVVDRKIAKKNPDELGIPAEFGFCKMFNVWPDLDRRPKKTDRGGDCMVRVGDKIVSVDVKGTDWYIDPHLSTTLTHDLENSADVFALVVIKGRVCEFRGWARAADLLIERRITRLQPHLDKVYAMPEVELEPPSTFFSMAGI